MSGYSGESEVPPRWLIVAFPAPKLQISADKLQSNFINEYVMSYVYKKSFVINALISFARYESKVCIDLIANTPPNLANSRDRPPKVLCHQPKVVSRLLAQCCSAVV